ncbi:Scr1 family TA system antitoxin-like transcriptional regulator [Streptomyces sp. H27-H1]|uniref:Scr1 family TA system antitoxin-like transcriptional regulator n=1 Tax=Streptomyces sp. H27-H1 TaxID=2996461 RepID=UPI00226E1E16|nr:Scr1 family TA system antitoxin-like transcriptional regulator [Streptomyces sp. H27-H1]MCY0930978.1 Scr1 family TA system antitoxin-like transcriptional regulator [Streptomyces sp. H27-H1]
MSPRCDPEQQAEYERLAAQILTPGAIWQDAVEAGIVPGLLQAPGYARALLARSVKDVRPDRMELLVALRMGRQQVLTRTAPPATLQLCPGSMVHVPLSSAVGWQDALPDPDPEPGLFELP